MSDEGYPTIHRPGLDHYVRRLRAGKVFTFSRWGDGEWRAALLRRTASHRNCDKHTFFPKMNHELRQVLLSKPPYELGLQALALKCYGNGIRSFIRQNMPEAKWYDSDVFHKASTHGEIQPLLSAVRALPLMIVGPEYLKQGRELLKFSSFVPVPQKNCYLSLDTIYKMTLDRAATMPKPFICSISASMPAEILIHRLYPHLGKSAFLIDFGSLYDCFVGHNTRGYHKDMRPETKAVNLKGLV